MDFVTNMAFSIGIFYLFCLFLDIEGEVCYSCTGVRDPSDCLDTTQCRHNEHCHVKKYADQTHQIYYDLGCLDSSICSVLLVYCSINRRSWETVLWNRCCSSEYCNVNFDIRGRVKQSSPEKRCYSCSDIADPSNCQTMEICKPDEVCYTHEQNTSRGGLSYKMGCLPKLVCDEDIRKHLLLGRGPGQSETCRGCCEIDHCNNRFCSGHIEGTGSLQITTGPTDVSVAYGGTAVFTCDVTGFPTPTVTWSFKNSGNSNFSILTTGVITTSTGSKLTVNKVSNTDFGTYICTARNNAGTQQRQAQLLYGGSPYITVPPTSQSVRLGDRVELPCKAIGTPKPQISWSFLSTTGQTLYPPGTSITLGKTAVITHMTKQDEGSWTCTATSTTGTDSATATLTVK